MNVGDIILVNVDQFYGIEIDEFAAKIAEVGMWLIDHQMNMKVSNIFGQYFTRLPLKASATIVHGNSLRLDWNDVVAKDELSFIIGNPPFIGTAMRDKQQQEDLNFVFKGDKSKKKLDYVSAWFYKSFLFIKNTNIKCALVSTNSIVQGEQVALLWNDLTQNDLEIKFAHRTFEWNNEAKGKAAVHCIIVGFGKLDNAKKLLFEYNDLKGEPNVLTVKSINPYLTSGQNTLIDKRRKPISNIPTLIRGNIPYDDGNLLFTKDKMLEFLNEYPNSGKLIRRYGGAFEMLNNKWRYCLWLQNIEPNEIRRNSQVLERIQKVQKFRSESKTISVKRKSDTPSLFGDIRQPNSDYLLIPRVSSHRRKYLPIGFISQDTIVADSAYALPNANNFLFGILCSKMHNVWMRLVAGRLKTDYRYSTSLVYNNYPFPKEPSEKNKKKVEAAAQRVLDVRAEFPNSSLADLYDPLAMPPKLVKAHQALDKAVDLCYRPQAFTNERNRIEFLFDLYEQYTAPLLAAEAKKKQRKSRKKAK